MSAFWSIFVIVLVALNIFGCLWLLMWTSKKRPGEAAESETTGHVWDENLAELNRPLPRWWLWLFIITVVFSLVYLVLYPGMGSFAGTLGWTRQNQHAADVARVQARQAQVFARFQGRDIAALAQDPEALRIGRNIFANNCATCHGSDGGGAPGFPNLTDGDWLYGGEPQTIEQSILNGRQGVMPAHLPILGEQGVAETAAYVYGLSGREIDAHLQTLADAGKPRFETICAACHGADGKGNPALGAPNLTDRIWLYGGSMGELKDTIAKGRGGRMPAHRELLGEDRVRLAAAYVYSLSAGLPQRGGDER
jgi:cytochrome c oxidase cbb3-type subunit 3